MTSKIDPARNREELFAISYAQQLENSDNSQFCKDIRAFGVLVLEMLVSLSEYNHDTQQQNSKTGNCDGSSSHCSGGSDVTNPSAFHMIPNTPVVKYGQTTVKKPHQSARQNDKHSNSCNKGDDQLQSKHVANCTCSNKVTDIRVHSRESHCDVMDKISQQSSLDSFDYQNTCGKECQTGRVNTFLEPIGEIFDKSGETNQKQLYNNPISGHDPLKIQKIQQRQLPPIPIQIEKVVAEVKRSGKCEESIHTSSDVDTNGERCEVIKSPVKKPKFKPKPNLLKSVQRHITVSESGESNVHALPSPTNVHVSDLNKPHNADTSKMVTSHPPTAAKVVFATSNKPSESSTDDVYNASSLNSCGSFETIYEDDESQDSLVQSLDSGLGKQGIVKTVAHVKRKVNGQGKHESEVLKKKRLSGTSFNESILSGDSGMGSSHYAASSEASQHIYAPPGSRGTIYQQPREKQLDGDSFSILNAYLERNRQKIGAEFGLNNSDDVSKSSKLSGYDPSVVSSVDGGSSERDYELLPDLMVRKKPCKGQHRHIPGVKCCSNVPPVIGTGINHSTGQTHSNEKLTMPTSTSCLRVPHTLQNTSGDNVSCNSGNIESISITKVLIDESTMTTDSLERPKPVPEVPCSLPTDSESVLTEISCTSGVTVGSRSNDVSRWINNSNKRMYDSDSQTSCQGHSKRLSVGRPNNVPKLGLTAVAFSRQMNNTTPLSCAPSSQLGSSQSLVTGRSSVMSGKSTGRQSVKSLPGGTNSINSSVLSLLQDSNLLVSPASGNRMKRAHRNQRSRRKHNRHVMPHQKEHSSNVVTNHPVVKQIVDMPSDNVAVVLDTLKRKGYLGYTAAQV